MTNEQRANQLVIDMDDLRRKYNQADGRFNYQQWADCTKILILDALNAATEEQFWCTECEDYVIGKPVFEIPPNKAVCCYCDRAEKQENKLHAQATRMGQLILQNKDGKNHFEQLYADYKVQATRIKELEAALKECEWANIEMDKDQVMIASCPVCLNRRSQGHLKDCTLAAAVIEEG